MQKKHNQLWVFYGVLWVFYGLITGLQIMGILRFKKIGFLCLVTGSLRNDYGLNKNRCFFLKKSKVKLSFATIFLRLVTVDYGLRGIMG